MDLMWEIFIIIIAIILILILFNFGVALKQRDLELMAKHFNPRH